MEIKKLVAKASMVGTTVLLAMPKVAFAQNWAPDTGYQGNMTSLIKTLLNTSIIMAAVVAVAFLVYNGFKYMVAAGDSGKTEEAQKGIANALIGLVICLAAAVVINFVLGRLDVNPGEIE